MTLQTSKIVDMNATRNYISSLSENSLSHVEDIDPNVIRVLYYSHPHDECNGIPLHLGNQAGGFPFIALGHEWKSVEHLYLCGEFSSEGDIYKSIQEDICTAVSGYAAKRFKKAKYKRLYLRSDFPLFREQWMLWCIWQKCIHNEDFKNHLLSLPEDYAIVEIAPKDSIWATDNTNNCHFVGRNGVGKILTICKRCLSKGSTPIIDTKTLNNANIFILGTKIKFK